ncbi:MAG: hypothetical protein SOV31_00205 [Candidatus Cryptobacteroides sp.]|nr:hypothetical protein [Candidatus Cryptobacteroides sp.]
MKKIYSIAISLLAVAAISSCVEENLAVFNPDDTLAQVLGDITGTTLTADGADLTATYDPAAFSVTSPVAYNFYLAPAGSEEGVKLASTIADGTITFKQKDLNSAILNLGAVADVAFSLDFWLVGYLCNDKGAAIAGTEVKSNVVTASFTPYSADINDVDVYEHIWIIGSGASVGAWDHGKVYQYLYNYNKDGNTFEGLIDYGEDAASGWKLTGIAGWDDSCNWGSENQAEDAEATSIVLTSSGGSKDIKCYSKRFYKWSFDKTSLTLKMVYGFNNVGLVGDLPGSSWNPADPDLKMEYNAYKHRFYIDYTFETATEIKFTCDDAWTLNWGAELAGGSGNIAAPAGSYRIYLDLNAMEYKFDANMFGKEEPGLPAGGGEEPAPAWSIIGTVDGTAWDTDFDLTEKESGVWTYSGLTLTDTDEFKLRKDHAWSESVGGPEANAFSNIDAANRYEVYRPELGTAFATGSMNIAVQAAGTYDVVYDTNAGTITVSEHVSGWTLIGSINDDNEWKIDVDMVEISTGLWVSPAVTINGEFKLRFNKDWTVNRGGSVTGLDVPFSVAQDGANLSVPAVGEKYVVTYYAAAEAVVVQNVSTSWSLIGQVDGSSWDKDIIMHKTGETTWSGACKVNGECKLRFGGDWTVNRGGTIEALDTPFAVTDGGSNIALEEGYYVFVYDTAAEQLTISQTWSLIGDVFSTGWGADFIMHKDANGNFVYSNAVLGGEWKLRFNGGWDVNRGGTFGALDTPFAVENNGSNIASPGTGLYNVVYNSKEETVTVKAAL